MTEIMLNNGEPVLMQMTNFAKSRVAEAMYIKGKAFIGAALLLRQDDGYEYVVLHLLCQGIEIVLKALLLAIDYDRYYPMLRAGKKGKGLGHDLLKAADLAAEASGLSILRPEVRAE